MSRKKKKQTKAGTNRGGSQRNPTPKNVSDFGSKLQNALATARSNNELPTESSKTGKTKQPPVKPDTGRVKSLTRRPSVEIGLSKTNSVGEADRTTKGRFTKQAYLHFHNGEDVLNPSCQIVPLLAPVQPSTMAQATVHPPASRHTILHLPLLSASR